MMRTYESPKHSVAAVSLGPSGPGYIASGPGLPGIPSDQLIFEIGSLTKVFTGILLCLLAQEGKIDPRTPLGEISSELADIPRWITPQSLAAHCSGLPRIHVSLWQALIKPLPVDPYADFSRADLLAWMRNWPARPPRKRRHLY
ncbi:MAG: serine hydrolase [Mangrovicoccus sp.]|nr:serine hydrolase [Mangrovicoccus sp.]